MTEVVTQPPPEPTFDQMMSEQPKPEAKPVQGKPDLVVDEASKEAPRDDKGKFAPNTPEESAKPEEKKPGESQGPKKDVPRHSPQARIDRITAEKKAAEAEAANLRAQKDQLEAELGRLRALKEEAVTKDPEPRESDFPNDYTDFVKAHNAWSNRQNRMDIALDLAQAKAEGLESQTAITVEDMRAANLASYAEKMSGIVKADPKFIDKLPEAMKGLEPLSSFARGPKGEYLNHEGKQVRITQDHFLAEQILASEQTKGLLEFFRDNPEEFQRARSLPSPEEMVRKIAKIEAKLEFAESAATATKAPFVDKASPPVRAVTGSPKLGALPPDATTDEFLADARTRGLMPGVRLR